MKAYRLLFVGLSLMIPGFIVARSGMRSQGMVGNTTTGPVSVQLLNEKHESLEEFTVEAGKEYRVKSGFHEVRFVVVRKPDGATYSFSDCLVDNMTRRFKLEKNRRYSLFEYSEEGGTPHLKCK